MRCCSAWWARGGVGRGADGHGQCAGDGPGAAVIAGEGVKMLLEATPVRISVGHLFYRSVEGGERSRYFMWRREWRRRILLLALDSRLKQRFGLCGVPGGGAALWATYKFPMFTASFTESGRERPREVEASQLLAVRISNFGGLVGNLAPGASISNGKLRVIAFKTFSACVSAIFDRGVVRTPQLLATIELVKCVSVECRNLEGSAEQLFVEADGELLARCR